MQKKHIQRFGQYGELQFENYIDLSITLHEDDLSSDEEGFTKLAAKWIIVKKRKQLPEEYPDQKPVRDLVINVKKKNPGQPSTEQRNSKEIFINESFKNIPCS